MLSRLSFVSLLLLTLIPSPGHALVSLPPAVGPMPASVMGRPRYASGHLLVRLRPGADRSRFLSETGLTVHDRIPEIDVDIVGAPAGQEESRAAALAARGDVLYAEPDFRCYASAAPGGPPTSRTPDDPYFSEYQWYLSQIHMPEAWGYATGTSSVIIAVLDTGVDMTHPDLQSKLVTGYNEVNPGRDPTDDEGHGTHVSGLAAASSDNGVGIAGVSWGALVMPVKVLDSTGGGSNSDIARGIIWAADHGAKVFNLSFGSNDSSSALASAVDYAYNKGGLILAAAGNDYMNGDPVNYPAALAHVMAIGASSDTDAHASYSESATYISVVAPGGDPFSDRDPATRHWIMSTYPQWEGSYQELAGTSQSTPLASGLAALLWSIRPDATADDVRSTIEQTAVDIGSPGKDPETGYGRIDALAAIAAFSAPLSDANPPSVSITAPANGAVVGHAVSITGSVQDTDLASHQVQYGIGAQPATWFSLGGQRSGTVQSGLLASWSTDGLTDGVYAFEVTAVDRAGHSTTAGPITVTVDNTPPAIALTSPADGQTVRGATPVVGSVTDPHLKQYEIDLGVGASPATWTPLVTQTQPAAGAGLGQIDWTGYAPGVYSLRVTASDIVGNTSLSQIQITYQAVQPGDINGDGKVDVADAVLVLQVAVGMLPPADLSVADVAPAAGAGGRPYGDGQITVADAVRVLRRALGLEPDPWP